MASLKNFRHVLIFMTPVAIFIGILVASNYFQRPFVEVKNERIRVEIADEVEERRVGLSNRDSLAENSGMLFIFERPDYHSFWMKDMRFSLDFMWIDETGTIVDVTQNVSAGTYPQMFTPLKPAKYVLEVNAGFIARRGVQIGDSVEFSL